MCSGAARNRLLGSRLLPGVSPRIFVTTVLIRRLDGRVFFRLAHRRTRLTQIFGGVVDISVSPDYFAGFYATLLGEEANDRRPVVSADTADGWSLWFAGARQRSRRPARSWPQSASRSGRRPSHSVIDAGAPEAAIRRVPGHPLYVVSGRFDIGDHRRMVGDDGGPSDVRHSAETAALFGMALRRTQREQAAGSCRRAKKYGSPRSR